MRTARSLALTTSALVLMTGLASGPVSAGPATAGASSSSSGGSEQADFNGDNFADLAVGVPFEDVGTLTDAGAVNVIYGSPGGLSATATPDQLWHQNSSGIQDTAGTGDQFGTAVAAGDFNGDGFADLAVGAPHEDLGTIVDAGVVHVIYGSPTGLSATGTPSQLWHQAVASVEGSTEPNDEFGAALAAANFGRGAQAALAIGVPGEDIGDIDIAGAVNVIYGSGAGLSATATPDQLWHQDSPEVQGESRFEDTFGAALAAANFGGGAQADLAIGVPGKDFASFTSPRPNAGVVNVIYGSPGGLSGTATPDQFWHQNSPEVEDTAETGDHFGSALGAANFGGSVQADLAVGVPDENVGSTDAGAVNVIYGSPSGLSATATPDQFWHQDGPAVQDAPETGDNFGSAMAASNFGGSLHADLAVGVPDESVRSITGAGAVNVIYGSPGGLSATVKPDQLWHQDSAAIQDEAEASDIFGSALAAANLGGSIQADLALGVPDENVGSTNAGAVNVIYGSPGGLRATGTPNQLWHQDQPSVEGVVEEEDSFGKALAAV